MAGSNKADILKTCYKVFEHSHWMTAISGLVSHWVSQSKSSLVLSLSTWLGHGIHSYMPCLLTLAPFSQPSEKINEDFQNCNK